MLPLRSAADAVGTENAHRAIRKRGLWPNLVKLIEASVKKGRLEFAVAWWPLHLAAALAVLALFAWRLNVNHRYHPLVLINAWKRRRHFKGAAAPVPKAEAE